MLAHRRDDELELATKTNEGKDGEEEKISDFN